MIWIFSLHNVSFCDLLFLTFCTVKRRLERMAIEYGYLHHMGKNSYTCKNTVIFQVCFI